MSVMNIAIAGGVVLLVLLLAKMRREKGVEKAPKAGKAPRGRGRGRRKNRNAPPAPPEPMPLAAAADAVAPTDEAPAVLTVPEEVSLRKVDLAIELQILSFYQLRRGHPIGVYP